ncbi:DUF1634 domain-containing protein [Paenibacillus popilliae]|uniref:Predicted membrane protein n=1 Tax=Paenibacillus popilliae ATCC 14706 TaxID=1212764 RepID=M9M252_PAEPP|nr:DUF1634 domain-containing protein [Paenibacillus popilliae]GAC41183.1 predicted membrane protein [Paenibacillus popilliae ATCC 14706]
MNSRADDVELTVSRLLRIGVVVAGLFIAFGLLLFLATGESGYPDASFPTTVAEVAAGVAGFNAYAFISLGLLLLILTPVFRVAVSILVFLKEGDRVYAGITALVLAILLISFVLGRAGT